MKNSIFFMLALCSAFLLTSVASAQIYENNYVWHNQAHSAWKIIPQSYQGYVIAGNKFFSSPNTDIYMTQFDEFGQAGWTRTHATTFSSLSTFWKSFCASPYPTGFFVVTSGTQGGQWRYYTLITNATGHKFYDQSGALPNGITFGGVCLATNGGYVACGTTNSGNMAVCKFDAYGVLEWTQTYSAGFGWSIAVIPGGGYVVAGGMRAWRIDHTGALQGTTIISLPNSPDGSAYTYSEFEEITFLPSPNGFLITGSIFSNQHSGVYTARLNYTGGVMWAKVNDQVNTSLPGTPVNWVNNAIVHNEQIITTWRGGPVSAGGTMYAQRMDFNGVQMPITSLNNTIPVREAFATRAHGRLVIGGTRGNLASAYSYVNPNYLLSGLMSDGTVDDGGDGPTLPFADEATLLGKQINVFSSKPEFETKPIEHNPASRTFYAEMRVYPNPTTGWVNVGGALEPGAMLRVSDLTGRVVVFREIQANETMLSLDLTDQTKGMFIVEMIGKENVTTKKIMVE